MTDSEPTPATPPRGRPIWKGTLGFGLVSVPVRLHRAVTPKTVRFHELHDQDCGRIRHRAICSIDGETVPYRNIVKGVEVGRGRWVTVSSDELHALTPAASRVIEIVEFVDSYEIDPMFYDRTYWLVPDEGAARAYALVGAAMAGLQRTAIARFTMRARQHLCAIRATAGGEGDQVGSVLALSTLRYAAEIRPASELAGLPGMQVRPGERELALAERLVASLSGRFRPEQYHDEQRQKVLAYLRRKVEGEALAPQTEPERAAPTQDLFGALEASLTEVERHKTAA